MYSSRFLFSTMITPERLGWVDALLKSRCSPHGLTDERVMVYLSGDALYSLIHPLTAPVWAAIASRPGICLYADTDDTADLGVIPYLPASLPVRSDTIRRIFLKDDEEPVHSAGFLHLYSPYMYRHTDFFLGIARQAIDLSVSLSVILYLDGVHLGHRNHRTREFSNAEQEMDAIRKKATDTRTLLEIAACERCSLARGYLHGEDGIVHPAPCFREDMRISGISNLIPPFSSSDLVLSADCGDIPGDGKEAYLLFVTLTPYGTENTFGALSWAVALAGREIPARIIYVEDGVYSSIEIPGSRISGSVRDIRAVADAMAVPGLLEFFVWTPSLTMRGIQNRNLTDGSECMQPIGTDGIERIREDLSAAGYHVRILIW